ncbi:5'-nucleotidase C-terminal domain-containing protein [Marinifilum sp.]|uniref:5'-nucleotidase C-terminal domain-containing protein n=1 Tax=Marinifilum sp. TaxID=2033137 RepID=UPI003BAB368C
MKNHLIKSICYAIVLLLLHSCATNTNFSTGKTESHYAINSELDKIAAKDTSLINLISSYKNKLDGEMNTIISMAETDLMVNRPEGLLSNFIADALFEIGNKYCEEKNLNHSVDLVIMNMGGIRSSLAKGEIKTGIVYEMLPFKNKLVIVGMKGKDLINLLHRVAYSGGEGVSNIKMGIKDRKAVDILVDGKPVDPAKIYHVISVDYLVNGGGGFDAFQNRETFRHMHKLLRSEIISYMTRKYKKGEKISAKKDGRIYNVE